MAIWLRLSSKPLGSGLGSDLVPHPPLNAHFNFRIDLSPKTDWFRPWFRLGSNFSNHVLVVLA